ncbi:unnamed protein product [Trifolium pratense]|uniref:Uncharacterized protein n=1 Tax=Trifolium pratense TaxID=57577 RepID=A0ACB0LDZ1_TRIPR|nr:unnamed protein product [Trifolium pratense]
MGFQGRIKEPWLRDLEQFRRRLVKFVFLDRASLKRFTIFGSVLMSEHAYEVEG